MKRFFFFFVALMVTLVTQSKDVILSQDFNGSFPPEGWTINDHAANWSAENTTNAGGAVPEARFNWSPSFTGTTRLITPPLDVSATGASMLVLSFSHMVDNYSGNYTIGIAARTNNGVWSTLWSQLVSASIPAENRAIQITDIEMLTADDLQFSFFFVGPSYNINFWYIDNVQVLAPADFDLGITKISMPSQFSGPTPVTGTVTSFGLEEITSFDLNWQIDGVPAGVQSFTGLSLGQWETFNFQTTSLLDLEPGPHTIGVSLTNINGENQDDYPENNELSVQIYFAHQTVQRLPLFEYFASSTCPASALFNQSIFNAFISQNQDELALIKYPMNWPSNGDPYYTVEGGIRKLYYNVPYTPFLILEGSQVSKSDTAINNAFQNAILDPSFMAIEGSHYYSGTNLLVEATIMPYADFSNVTIHVVAVEDTTTLNVGGNGETYFKHVMMKMLPDANGTIADLTALEPLTISHNFNMSGTFVEEMSDLKVVIFVQNESTREVYQAGITTGSEVPPMPPLAPQLASPEPGSDQLPENLVISWNPVDFADDYGIQVSNQEDFSAVLFDFQGVEGTSMVLNGLDYSTQYFWRANASNGAGTGPWSEVWSFSTLQYLDLEILSGESYCHGDQVNLGVSPNGPIGEGNVFTVELSDVSGSFESPIVLQEIQTSLSFDAEVSVPDTLSLGVAYLLRVRSSSPEAFSEAYQVTFYGYPGADFIISTDALCWGEMAEIVYTNSVSEAATFTWDFDGGSAISGEGAGPYLVSWPTDGFKNIFLSVEENGCASENTDGLFVAPETQPNPICMVTVNEENKNMILFEQPEGNAYESIVLYKEGSQAGVYSLIASQAANGLGYFVDEDSNPAQNSSRYKIAVVDTCGYETPMSDFHKTMHLTISAGINDAWNLIWDKYEGFVYSTFNIYRGTSEGALNLIAELPSNLFTYTDQAPPAGTAFYQIEVVNPNPCDVNLEKSGKEQISTSRSNLVNSQQATPVVETVVDPLQVWPNPTRGVLYLQGDFAPGERTLEILSVNGNIMKSLVLRNDENEIDMTGLPEGVYFIRIIAGKKTYHKRVIKL